MTPSMRLSELKRGQPLSVVGLLEKAFTLGHEFGLERAVRVVDECNQEGSYSAIVAAARIRRLVVVAVEPVSTQDSDFLDAP